MPLSRYWGCFLLFCLLGLTQLQAQRPFSQGDRTGGFDDRGSDRSQGEFEDQLAEEPDTFGVFIFFAENPSGYKNWNSI